MNLKESLEVTEDEQVRKVFSDKAEAFLKYAEIDPSDVEIVTKGQEDFVIFKDINSINLMELGTIRKKYIDLDKVEIVDVVNDFINLKSFMNGKQFALALVFKHKWLSNSNAL